MVKMSEQARRYLAIIISHLSPYISYSHAHDSPCMSKAQIMSDFVNRQREWMINDAAYWSPLVSHMETDIGKQAQTFSFTLFVALIKLWLLLFGKSTQGKFNTHQSNKRRQRGIQPICPLDRPATRSAVPPETQLSTWSSDRARKVA